MRFSRNGKHLAARYQQGERIEWKVWDLDRCRVCAEAKDGSLPHCVDFARDGRWVALGTKERALRLLDLATGEAMAEVGRGFLVKQVDIHPGGQLIAFSSERTRKVHIHDRGAGHVIRSLAGGGDHTFEQVAWHPDGRTLAAANVDHLVYVWNAETGELSRSLQGHWAEVKGVSFNPEGFLFASWGWDPAVRFWEPGSDSPAFSIHREQGYFGSGARSFWTISADHVEQCEIVSASPAFTLFGHEGTVTKQPHSIALAPGGRLAATGGDDGVRLWDLAARKEAADLDDGKVISVLFDPAGGALYSSGWAGLRRWPLRTIDEGGVRIAIGPPQRLAQVESWQRADLGGGGHMIGAVHEETHAHLFDPIDPERAIILSGLPPSWSVALSPDGAWVAAGGLSLPAEEVWVWDVRAFKPGDKPEPVRKLPGPRAEVKFHPGGTHLATCTPQDCTLWKIPDGEPAWRIERERGLTFPGKLAFDRDGKIAAIGHSDSRIWLVEAGTGRKLSELEAPEPILVTCLALEGGTLAASTNGHRFHVWDLNGLEREVAGLGLIWDVPTSGRPFSELPPIHVAVVEESIDLLLDEASDIAPRRLFRPTRFFAFLPQLVSCAQIDQALASPTLLIPEGERWKYFRGRAEPSPGMEWTGLDFDDGRWEEGRSPLTSWTQPEGSEHTLLADQLGSYTTLYARRAFEVPDPAAVLRLVLAAEVEDGLVAYLNGAEVGRARASKPGERLPFQALANRADRPRATEVLEVSPSFLRPGRNVLALQVLSYGLDSRLHVLPVLAAAPAPEAERDRRRADPCAPASRCRTFVSSRSPSTTARSIWTSSPCGTTRGSRRSRSRRSQSSAGKLQRRRRAPARSAPPPCWRPQRTRGPPQQFA
ncbi:MAG: hypothetical protein HY721_00920 [Planctomycetes bacterium]|nr:hypothetical protein [Planctomycetota bacterium]